MTHHLHPNPDVDDMLRAAKARAEAAERSKSALVEKVKRLQDQIARARMEPGQDRQKAMHAYADRAEAAERRLAEQQAAVREARREIATLGETANDPAPYLRAIGVIDAALSALTAEAEQ